MKPLVSKINKAMDEFSTQPTGRYIVARFNLYEWFFQFSKKHLPAAEFTEVIKWAFDELKLEDGKIFSYWLKVLDVDQSSSASLANQFEANRRKLKEKLPRLYSRFFIRFLEGLVELGHIGAMEWREECAKIMTQEGLEALICHNMNASIKEVRTFRSLIETFYRAIGYHKVSLLDVIQSKLTLHYPKDEQTVVWFMIYLATIAKDDTSVNPPYRTNDALLYLSDVQAKLESKSKTFFTGSTEQFLTKNHTLDTLWDDINDAQQMFLAQAWIYFDDSTDVPIGDYAKAKSNELKRKLMVPSVNPNVQESITEFLKDEGHHFPAQTVESEIRLNFFVLVSLLSIKDESGMEPIEKLYIQDLQNRLYLSQKDKAKIKAKFWQDPKDLSATIPDQMKIPLLIEMFLLALVDGQQDSDEMKFLQDVWKNLGITKEAWATTREFLGELKETIKAVGHDTILTMQLSKVLPDIPTDVKEATSMNMLKIMSLSIPDHEDSIDFFHHCEQAWAMEGMISLFQTLNEHPGIRKSLFKPAFDLTFMAEIVEKIDEGYQPALFYESLNMILRDGYISKKEGASLKQAVARLVVPAREYFYIVLLLYLETGNYLSRDVIKAA